METAKEGMRLDALTLTQCEKVRLWRNNALETLRTPYPLTQEAQEHFFLERVVNSNSPHRYYAIINWPDDAQEVASEDYEGMFIGMGGLTYISWENRIAEISLILDPIQRGKGLGEQAVDLLLAEGFDRMGLKSIYGECYASNTNGYDFWLKLVETRNWYFTTLPNRKFWHGRWWDAIYFSIDADDWRKVKNGQTT